MSLTTHQINDAGMCSVDYAELCCLNWATVIQLPPDKAEVLNFTTDLGIKLYGWQMEALANIQAGWPTAIVARSGTGKTSTVLVPAALWCLYTWPLARVVIAAASWNQLLNCIFWP
jgi:hypothetical protein